MKCRAKSHAWLHASLRTCLCTGKGNSTWARELSRASERSASPAVGTQPIKRTVRRTVSRAVKQIVRRSSAAPTGRCDACAKACRPCCVGGSTFLHAGQCEGCVGCAQCAAAVCAAGTAPPERGSVGPGPTKARGHGARGDSRVAAKVKSTGHQRRRRRGINRGHYSGIYRGIVIGSCMGH